MSSSTQREHFWWKNWTSRFSASDSLNRLTTSNENGANWSQTNGYDRYGNRWIDLGGGNQSLYFNTSNNRISGWSYDAAGNLLNDGSHSYTYDAENKIAKVDTVSAYIYDGEISFDSRKSRRYSAATPH